MVLEMGKASTSTLQRRLRLGYGRAARILDMMQRDGIIGPPDGSKPREVLKRPDWLREVDAPRLRSNFACHTSRCRPHPASRSVRIRRRVEVRLPVGHQAWPVSFDALRKRDAGADPGVAGAGTSDWPGPGTSGRLEGGVLPDAQQRMPPSVRTRPTTGAPEPRSASTTRRSPAALPAPGWPAGR